MASLKLLELKKKLERLSRHNLVYPLPLQFTDGEIVFWI